MLCSQRIERCREGIGTCARRGFHDEGNDAYSNHGVLRNPKNDDMPPQHLEPLTFFGRAPLLCDGSDTPAAHFKRLPMNKRVRGETSSKST